MRSLKELLDKESRYIIDVREIQKKIDSAQEDIKWLQTDLEFCKEQALKWKLEIKKELEEIK